MFSSEYYEIFKNNFFYRTPRVAASETFFHVQSRHAYGYYTHKRNKCKTKSSVKMFLREIFRDQLTCGQDICRLVFSHLYQVHLTRSGIMLKNGQAQFKNLRS